MSDNDAQADYWSSDAGRKWITHEAAMDASMTAVLDRVLALAALAPGQRVLDIGCGWGGMAIFLAQRAGVHVTGITLSREQAALARERVTAAGVEDKVSIELIDYRDHADQGHKYDRIVSVGMFEHVGVNHYGEYFKKARTLLKDDGVMVMHTIGRTGPPSVTSAFIRKYIFPGGYIPALSEIMSPVEHSGLHVTDVEVLTDHYAETLKAWRERFMARRDEAAALYDERFARMWEFYLAASEAAFRYQDMVVFQVQLAKSKLSIPRTRDYITDFDRRHGGNQGEMRAAE